MRNDQNNASVLMEPTILSENRVFVPNCVVAVPAVSATIAPKARLIQTQAAAAAAAVKVSIAAKKISEAAKSRRKTHYMKKILQLKGGDCGSNNGVVGIVANSEKFYSSMQNQAIGSLYCTANAFSDTIMGRTKTKQQQLQQQQQQQIDLKVSVEFCDFILHYFSFTSFAINSFSFFFRFAFFFIFHIIQI